MDSICGYVKGIPSRAYIEVVLCSIACVKQKKSCFLYELFSVSLYIVCRSRPSNIGLCHNVPKYYTESTQKMEKLN